MNDTDKNNAPDGKPERDDKFTKTREWTRPKAMARDSSVSAWLALLGFILLGFALWRPIQRLYWETHNRAISSNSDAVPRRSTCFLAISYEGVASETLPGSQLVTTDLFREHIAALKAEGYTPITLEDVRAFYHEKKPLPDKALLLTFENCRKSTYFETRDILAKNRWHAVMGVLGKPVKENNKEIILRQYLSSMQLDATWDLADQSYAGAEPIPSSASGADALFFASPKWLADQERHEQFEEFAARIESDHRLSIKELESNVGAKPIAFFFPFGNYGQYEEGNKALREANLASVERNYALGFIRNHNALNDARTDYRRLNRLEVTPSWSAEELVAHLNASWPAEARRSRIDSLVKTERWIQDWGVFDARGTGFSLRAESARDPLVSDEGTTAGARAWIAGSNSFKDGSYELRFNLVRGELHAYLRYSADDCWLLVAVTDGGRASVSRCEPGNDVEVLANDALESAENFRTTHSLLITLRDDVIFARLDGRQLFGGAVVVGDTPPGMVGLAIWSPAAGLAQVDVAECRLRSRIDAVVTWTPDLFRDPGYLMSQLAESAFRYTIISPPWFDAYASSPISYTKIDTAAFSLSAHANHNRLFPRVAIHGTQAVASLNPIEIAANLAELKVDGLYLDATDYSSENKLTPLLDWIMDLRNALASHNLGLAVRFAPSLTGLSTIGNFVSRLHDVLVVDENAVIPPGLEASRALLLTEIQPPATDQDLAIFFQVSETENSGGGGGANTSLSLRKAGIKAFSEGRYADAVEKWKAWQKESPLSAEAWALIGNAYSRMREYDLAAEAYGNSLRIEPGQIPLMIELARILETANRPKDAAALLDLYARAFPDDTEVAIAQASWLDRHGQRGAGRDLLRAILTNAPGDINSRLTLQGLIDDPKERYRNMHELLEIGGRSDTQLIGFGHDISSAELLTIPEASVFFEFIRDTADHGPTETIRSLYDSFLPLTNSITEKFDAARLSDNWIALGTPLAHIAGAYDLQAASDMSEAYLRLKKSELLRDAFIEVTVGEAVGAFWLYARRSPRSMIRFGFDSEGFARIQTWQDGELRTGLNVSWKRPAGDIRLRLEVRGDGAIGIIDDKQMFATPLKVPSDIAYGSWSVAPFSPELGIARARIGRIVAGPLSPTLVMMRETDVATTAAKLDSLRPFSRDISALSPVLFAQTADGAVATTPMADLMPYRLFCSYHRIRLMPAVALDYYSDVNPEMLVKIILEHKLSGLVLLVRAMPPDSWFEKMTQLLEQTTADLVVVQSEVPLWPLHPDAKPADAFNIREIQRGSVLFQPNRSDWDIESTIFPAWPSPKRRNSCVPTIVIMPQGEVGEKAEEADAKEDGEGEPKEAQAPEEAKQEPDDAKDNEDDDENETEAEGAEQNAAAAPQPEAEAAADDANPPAKSSSPATPPAAPTPATATNAPAAND